MMKFLFYTQHDDTHALIVQAALESLGHEVQMWFTGDQPSLLSHSISLDLHHTLWGSSDKSVMKGLSEYDVVWYRRSKRPYVPRNLTHPEDHEFVNRENQIFFDGMTTLFSTQAWWINSPVVARRANAKLLQLHMAKTCGLKIPTTLCSNAPEDIRLFFKIHHHQPVIYKPLCSTFWAETAQVKALYTSFVQEQDLPDDEMLKLTPGLFQSYVEKQYELRITCFGSHCVAVKLNSQAHASGKVDWRMIPEHELQLSYYSLPQHIEYKLQTLMRRLGLMFACIDMIVTPAGEYVFLELNEQGQFLWIEELDSSIQLLDRFILFLLNRSYYFNWSQHEAQIVLADYREALRAKLCVREKQQVA
jgi:glutathione synthase/RimK-type ligase-like ATP-grasp enzyme